MLKAKVKMEKIKQLHAELSTDASRSVADICNAVGISKSTFHAWKDQIINYRPDDVVLKTIRDYPPLLPNADAPVDTYGNFINIPIIINFEKECKINKKNPHLSHLFRLCNAANMHPDTIAETINNAKTAFMEFDTVYHRSNPTLTNERYRKVLRSFLQFNGIIIPNKDPVLHGGSDSQGDYATVQLTPTEVERVAAIIGREKGEQFEDLFRIHHEAFPRPQTLHSWMPVVEIKHVDVDGNTYPFGQTSVFEKKQHKHYNKLILHPKALDIITKYQGKRIIDVSFRDFITDYSAVLKKAYYEIGKIIEDQRYPKGTEGWLWFNKPIYSIRHSAAVQWINRTSFDVNLVATMGWEKPDTLTKYYARISTSNIMEKGICYYCSPPSVTSSQPVFCSAPHALAWIHGAKR